MPFINYPALVKTSWFEVFKHIEYDNSTKLNYLIENIETIVNNDELRNSVRTFKDVVRSSTKALGEQIVLDKRVSDDSGLYGEQRMLLDQMITEYIDKNEPFLRKTFRVLLLGEPVQYDFAKSKYFKRRYVQRIFEWMSEEQKSPNPNIS